MSSMRLAASLLALCAAPWASAFTASSALPQLLRSAPTSLSTRRPVAAAASRLRAVATSPEGEEKSAGPRGSMEPADFQTPKEKGRERLLQIQNGAFALGSVLIAVACIGHVLRAGEDPAFVGPTFKAGSYVFFLGVALQYSETYSRCAYIRFARETLMNPVSVAKRARRVLALVDGNIFKFLLPGIFGRSYDIIDGVPVEKEGWDWKKTPWQDK